MSEAEYAKVDPRSCIPFSQYRQISTSGVYRLMMVFDGNILDHATIDDESADTASCGLSLGTDTSMIVPLVGSLKVHVHNHVKEHGCTAVEVNVKVKYRSI